MLSEAARPGRSPRSTQVSSAPTASDTASMVGTRPYFTKKGVPTRMPSAFRPSMRMGSRSSMLCSTAELERPSETYTWICGFFSQCCCRKAFASSLSCRPRSGRVRWVSMSSHFDWISGKSMRWRSPSSTGFSTASFAMAWSARRESIAFVVRRSPSRPMPMRAVVDRSIAFRARGFCGSSNWMVSLYSDSARSFSASEASSRTEVSVKAAVPVLCCGTGASTGTSPTGFPGTKSSETPCSFSAERTCAVICSMSCSRVIPAASLP